MNATRRIVAVAVVNKEEQRSGIFFYDPLKDASGESVPWNDYGFRWAAYTLAHLYAS